MKRKIFAVAALLAVGTGGAMAQGPFATLNVGYGLSAGSDNLGSKTTITSDGAVSSEAIYGTIANGIFVDASVGYMFGDHVGADIGVSYLMGSKVVLDEVNDNATDGTSITEAYTRQIRLNPGIVVTTANEEGLNVFARTGIVLPVSGTTFGEINATQDVGGGVIATTLTKSESQGAMSVGYTGSLGASYGLNEKMSVFAALKGTNLRIKQESRKVTESMTDAGGTIIDNLDGLPAQFTETTYVDSVGATDNDDPSQPLKVLAGTSNFSSLAINIGVKFSF